MGVPQDDVECKLTEDWQAKIYPSEQDRYIIHYPVRIYLAGPWFWPAAKKCLREALCVLNADDRFNIWCAMAHGDMLDMKEYLRLRKEQPASELETFDRQWDHRKHEAFQENLKRVRWCDILIAMIENWDSGTMFETGGARILEKPCIMFSYVQDRKCNLMLEQAAIGFTTNVADLIPMIDHKILSRGHRRCAMHDNYCKICGRQGDSICRYQERYKKKT